MSETGSAAELLRWYVAMGADEAIAEAPIDRLAAAASVVPPSPPPRAAPPVIVTEAPAGTLSARQLAAAAKDLGELAAAVHAFDGCALKRTATNTVVADGRPGARLMVIGEAPGAEEDRLGRPFVGRSGQLLDRMLAAIGFDRRENAYITNVLFWRPPGNRKPNADEIAACLPFVWRQIALGAPEAVVMCGGTATSALLGRAEGIMRLRGRWFELTGPGLDRPVPALATYHPSFLLRAPARKGEAWRDLLALQSKLGSAQ
ncbi:MAG TPA: uracil-DNA glycosylase [Stellaceae bacterium]|jgi:DNA polymerase|nr:uracil-DNA glycosylase [Stellaceae bacterium]